MKRAAYGVAISLGLALVIGTGIPAHSGMIGHDQMGQSESSGRTIARRQNGHDGAGCHDAHA